MKLLFAVPRLSHISEEAVTNRITPHRRVKTDCATRLR